MAMKIISEIRYKNFIDLLNEFQKLRGGPKRGLLKDFGSQVNISDRQLSHLKCKNRPIGNISARKIEQGLGLEIGWMDNKSHEIKIKIASVKNDVPKIKKPRENQREHRDVAQRNTVVAANKQEQLFIETALRLYRNDPLKAYEYLLPLLK